MIILEDFYENNDLVISKINNKIIACCGCQIFNARHADKLFEKFNINQSKKQQALDMVNDVSEETDYIKLIELDVRFIIYIHNPSEAVQLEAVKKDGDSIRYIHNPSEAIKSASNSFYY